MKTKYLKIELAIFREDGWNDDKVNKFMKKFNDLLDEYPKELLHCAVSWARLTEKEVLND